jgi:hypothetical protein
MAEIYTPSNEIDGEFDRRRRLPIKILAISGAVVFFAWMAYMAGSTTLEDFNKIAEADKIKAMGLNESDPPQPTSASSLKCDLVKAGEIPLIVIERLTGSRSAGQGPYFFTDSDKDPENELVPDYGFFSSNPKIIFVHEGDEICVKKQ